MTTSKPGVHEAQRMRSVFQNARALQTIVERLHGVPAERFFFSLLLFLRVNKPERIPPKLIGLISADSSAFFFRPEFQRGNRTTTSPLGSYHRNATQICATGFHARGGGERKHATDQDVQC
jgi:hypothetical protein